MTPEELKTLRLKHSGVSQHETSLQAEISYLQEELKKATQAKIELHNQLAQAEQEAKAMDEKSQPESD